MKMEQSLNKLFDIEPAEELLPVVADPGVQKENDFDLARETLRDLIHKNDTVLNDLISIARNSEHPRAFEVVGQLVKAQSEIAKDLMGLHKQKKEISDEETTHIKQQNNIVFAGSTSDLMKLISAQKAKIE